MFRQYKLRDYRFSLVLWVLILSTIGIMVIGSAREAFQIRQIYGLILGMTLMILFSLVDYNWVLHLSWLIYGGAIGLLVAVLLFGEEVNGARRWITIGIQFQPSDLAKIALIVFFAGLFSRYEEKINDIRFILISLVMVAVPLFLIQKEPDLSTTIVTALTFCVILFAAGLSFKIVAGILLVTVPSAVILFSMIIRPGQMLLHGYQLNRILAWLYPEDYPELAYQQQNSIIAIGSGQLYGKGLNNNMVSSVKGGGFIAEPQTDFIFAVLGEELGFLGCVACVFLELFIAWECIRIARRARDTAGMLIACGMGTLIMLQSTMNIAVATGLMPNTGIPLPFVSYGVTSLIAMCIGIGLVLNVGLQARRY